jgi:nucleoside-diphosphate-sugar epimerase
MRALVTGGTGFVGRHLIDALLRRGDQVTALVRTPAKAAGLGERGVRLVAGDLADTASLTEAARGQDVVYHVAGLTAGRSEAEFHSVNQEGTARLVAAAARVSTARVVLVSSMAAAGPAARGARHTGAEPAQPVTAYGRSKLAGEETVKAGPLPWTIVRPPAVYGPFDTELLRLFRAVKLGIVPVFGDGSQELSMVYGPDLGMALAAAGASESTIGGTYYACHSEVVTSATLIAEVGRAVGVKPRLVHLPRWSASMALGFVSGVARLRGRATLLTPDKAKDFFAPAWTADPAPLHLAAGWRAEHEFARGAAATAEWYRSVGWL